MSPKLPLASVAHRVACFTTRFIFFAILTCLGCTRPVQDNTVAESAVEPPGVDNQVRLVTETDSHGGSTVDVPTDWGKPSPLPLPSSMSTFEYEQLFYPFLNERKYQELGWLRDKCVRDTGPYIDGVSYGTHPAVRIFYSPEIIQWLVNDRQGDIPDGAMIVKEHFEEPAARHHEKDEAQLWESLKSWTVMVKDAQGSIDGWFWSNPGKDAVPKDNHQYMQDGEAEDGELIRFNHPESGFGHYCVRCHASTKSPGPTNEYTFASLRNIEGFPGWPLIFRVDDSWREEKAEAEPTQTVSTAVEGTDNTDTTNASEKLNPAGSHRGCTNPGVAAACAPRLNRDFLAAYDAIKPFGRSKAKHFPPVTHDWVTMDAAKTQSFITSNQCMSCHAGLVGPLGHSMYLPNSAEVDEPYPSDGMHISPYGEWRWTPMGLAGRDPVFHAQMELEQALLIKQYSKTPEKAESYCAELTQTCLSCHGVMGRHEMAADHPHRRITLDDVYATAPEGHQLGQGDGEYGALARDGVSCTVCHRAVPREQPEDDNRSYLEYYLATSITGNLKFAEPGKILGPFKSDEISPYAMEHAVGYKPEHNDYIQSSRMCGSCHTVNLPVVEKPFHEGEAKNELATAEQNPAFQDFRHHVEQATYLEWLNSEFEDEFNENNPKAQTCQQCHMDRSAHDVDLGIEVDKIESRIAAIQDMTYPDAENLASHEELNVRVREEGYARHNFVGLNAFLVEMFNQFDDILGVRKNDFMTGSKTDLEHSLDNFRHVAETKVGTIDVAAHLDDGLLAADVTIRSDVGHRFPSGVGFRRAFVELLVLEDPKPNDAADREPRIVWSSGRTNKLGMLLGGDGEPLATEFFGEDPDTGKETYQKHHEVITSSDQVQVYETLLWDIRHRFTTSFIRGCDTVKDNRILPRGWKKDGPSPDLNGFWLKATMPGPVAMQDSDYTNGSGSDKVAYRIDLPDDVDPSRLRVQATLYYQAMPPYFLKALFDIAGDQPATQRLHYILSNMRLDGTIIEDWKLKVLSASATIE